MTVEWLILIPLIGGVLAWIGGRRSSLLPRLISVASLGAGLAMTASLWNASPPVAGRTAGQAWIAEFNTSWIPQLGIGFHLGLDGLSLLLVLLTFFLGIVGVLCSWNEIKERTGFFHLNLMLVLTGIVGVFLSLDLFLFYFFWELMLVPMYFLISIWGHEKRAYASVKFFIFTQLSGILMLLGILGLYFIHGRSTGIYTFDYTQLLGTRLTPGQSLWLMLGFAAAFAVKLPAVPFHSWLPDAHSEAPTAGSLILAGLLLKTGAYGFIRFLVPLFPDAVESVRLIGMVLSAAGILYGAALAFSQEDLKRLIAYTSISHMGFVMLGIFAWNELSLQGAVIQMVCHGFSTGALFVLAGILQERLHTREMSAMGGLWAVTPRMAGMGLFFGLASLGLPGLGNFIGEFLVLLGSYRVSGLVTAAAATGLIASALYSLRLMQRVFHGPKRDDLTMADIAVRETTILAVMAAVIVVIGLYPGPVLETSKPAVEGLIQKGNPSLTPPGRGPGAVKPGGESSGEMLR